MYNYNGDLVQWNNSADKLFKATVEIYYKKSSKITIYIN